MRVINDALGQGEERWVVANAQAKIAIMIEVAKIRAGKTTGP